MSTARRLGPFAGFVALLALTGCDIYIPIFHEDPTTLSDDRTEEVKLLDDRIRGDILSGFVEQDVGTLKNVTIDVYEQRVLLAGTVTAQEARETAGAVAASTQDVASVINEIQAMKDSSLRDKAEDLSIENRIKANLRESSAVNSFNLRWRSVNGVVYLFGRVVNEQERDKALAIVQAVSGVKDVVNHIAVRPHDGEQSWLDNLL
jgi:osmotically-inducible protein OsmY